jgi:hypothetical protein
MEYTDLISRCMHPSYLFKHGLRHLIRPDVLVNPFYIHICSYITQLVRILRPFNDPYGPNGKTSTFALYFERSDAKFHPNLIKKGSEGTDKSYLSNKKIPPQFRWVVLEISKKECQEVMFATIYK